jgi:hypothetical protein
VKYVSVPASYALYEVPDESFLLLSDGRLRAPPQIVLELMVMNGQAKRSGTIATAAFGDDDNPIIGDDSEEESEDNSPWVEDNE